MTVVKVTTVDHYVGLSSDSKPSSPPAGSLFWETDTGVTYIYSGSAWGVKR